MQIEKTLAVLIVAAALVFVVYTEASDTISGAFLQSHVGYVNCYDTDLKNDVTIQGTVTVSRWNLATDNYEPLEPFVDECIGPSRVREWICLENDRPYAIETNTYCMEDSTCINGACVR